VLTHTSYIENSVGDVLYVSRNCSLQVEMFAVTANESRCESDDALTDFVDIQLYLFEQLGLHFRFAQFIFGLQNILDIICFYALKNMRVKLQKLSGCVAIYSAKKVVC